MYNCDPSSSLLSKMPKCDNKWHHSPEDADGPAKRLCIWHHIQRPLQRSPTEATTTKDGVNYDASDPDPTSSSDEKELGKTFISLLAIWTSIDFIVMVKRRSGWSSSVYDHFHPVQIAETARVRSTTQMGYYSESLFFGLQAVCMTVCHSWDTLY